MSRRWWFSPITLVWISGRIERLRARSDLAWLGAVDHVCQWVRRLGLWARDCWSRIFTRGPGTAAPRWSGWLMLVPSGLVLAVLVLGAVRSVILARVCRSVNRRWLRESLLYRAIVYDLLVQTLVLIVVAVPAGVFAVDETFLGHFDAMRFLTVPTGFAIGGAIFPVLFLVTFFRNEKSAMAYGKLLDALFEFPARHLFLRQAALFGLIVTLIHTPTSNDETTPDVVFVLMILVVLAAALTKGSIVWRAVLTVVIIAWAAWTNGRDPYKLTYPGLEVNPALTA